MHYVRCFCKERLRYGGGIIMTSEIYEALHAEIYGVWFLIGAALVRLCRYFPIMRISTGRHSSLTWSSARRQRRSSPVRWRSGQNSYPTVSTPQSSPR